MSRPSPPRYDPQATSLYRLLEQCFDEVKGTWDEIFEERYGFWRGLAEALVFRYLDCGIYERGAARVRCPSCREEYLLAEDLLGRLPGAACETLRELMVAGEGAVIQIGMVAAVHTFGDFLRPHPHVHAIVSRGGWDRDGTWHPVPYLDEHAAERLFRHKVIKLLRDAGLLDQRRIELLLSWKHTGFSARGETHIGPTDRKMLEAVARYLLRRPISLARFAWRLSTRGSTMRPTTRSMPAS